MTAIGEQLVAEAVDVTRYQYGTVTAVSPLLIRLDSEETDVQTVSVTPYGLAVDDRVLVLVQGADRIVLAKSPAATAWVYPTLLNSWVDFGGLYRTVRYRKLGDIVYVEGLVRDGTVNTAAFTLDVGFRPPLIVQSANSAFLSSYVTVEQDGDVIVQASSNTGNNINCSFSTTP